MKFFSFVIPITYILFFFSGFSLAVDIITQSQSISDGGGGSDRTLVSNSGRAKMCILGVQSKKI
jgi:hypothetical protein